MMPAGSNEAFSRRWTSIAGIAPGPRPPLPLMTGAMPPTPRHRRTNGVERVRVAPVETEPDEADAEEGGPIVAAGDHVGDARRRHGRLDDRGRVDAERIERARLVIHGDIGDHRLGGGRLLLDLIGPPFQPHAYPAGLGDHGGRKGHGLEQSPAERQAVAFDREHPADLRERTELQRDLHDHAQRPQRARGQPVHVVAGDVLHRAGSALHEQAVAADQFELDDRVTDVAETQPAEGRHPRGDHPADRRLVGSVDRPLLTALGEDRLELAHAHPRLDDGEHLGRLVRHDLVHHRGPELGVDLDAVAAIHMCPAADHEQPRSLRRRLPHGVRDVVLRVRVDQIHEPSGRFAAASAASEPRIIA